MDANNTSDEVTLLPARRKRIIWYILGAVGALLVLAAVVIIVVIMFLPSKKSDHPSDNVGSRVLIIGGNVSKAGNSKFTQKAIFTKDGAFILKGRGADMPEALKFAPAAIYHDQAFVVAGYNDKTLQYDISKDSWTVHSGLIQNRSQQAVFVLGSNLYAAGGEADDKGLTSMEFLDIKNIKNGWKISDIKLSQTFSRAASVVVKDKVYVAGGVDPDKNIPTAKMITWSVNESDWTDLADMSDARWGHCMVSDGHDNIWVIGGYNGPVPHKNTTSNSTGGQFVQSVEQYSISSGKWNQIFFPYSVSFYSICLYANNTLFVTGGATVGKDLNIYDLATGSVTQDFGAGYDTMGGASVQFSADIDIN